MRQLLLTVAALLVFASGAHAQSTFPGRLPVGCANGQVPVYNSSTRVWDCGAGGGGSGDVTASGTLANNAIALGGGTTVVKTTTTGTGVVTALGVNVGSAGAFVVNGGALGTPTSGSGANLLSIPPGGITFAASDRVLCRDTASGGVGEECTAANIFTMNGTVSAAQGGTGLTAFTRSGNTTEFVTVSGAKTSGDCVEFDASGNVVAAGAACGSGGGLSNVVEDLTPQLGGNLDLNTFVITGLVIGTNVQAYDADLTTWAGVTPGTGVATALAVNVGSAGAFTTFNGALGTPSSGVATNLTGAPTFTSLAVSDEAYDATGWNADLTVPTKNAVRDAFESILVITAPATGTDLGAAATAYRDLYLYGAGTYSSTSMKFTGTPTGDRVYTFPNASSSIPVFGQTITFAGPTAARTVTLPDEAFTVVGLATTQTLTNKTYDVEGTGNVFTDTVKYHYNTAVSQGTTASLGMSCKTALCPTAVSVAGTNVFRGWATFPDSDGEFGLQGEILLPSDWTGQIAFNGMWKTTGTGNVVIQVRYACTATAEAFNDTWETAQTVTDAAGTSGQPNAWAIADFTPTGCAAGELFMFETFRQRTNGSDSLNAAFDLGPITATARRAK